MLRVFSQKGRRERAIRFAVVAAFLHLSSVAFGIQKQTPLSVVREKAGLAFHTRARQPESFLSRESQILLSDISDAGSRGDWLKVQKLFGTYAGSEEQIFSAVMHIAVNCSQFKQGAAVYAKACNLNISKTSPTFSAALKIHARLNRQETVKQIWTEALQTCPLNEVLAGARLDAAAIEGDVETAAEVLDLLNHTSGVRTDVAHVTSAIRACWEAEGRSHHAAKFLFQHLLDLGLQPNIVAYTCLIGAYATAPLPQVLAAYDQLKSSDVAIDSPFTEVYFVTVLQKPKPEDWRGEKMIEKLKARPLDRLAAARVALHDFNAARLELSALSLSIQRALLKLEQ
ncbi:PPR4 [Symbiodinium sp. CCMP2456]|nr:PPR4 [Symbiodinium sp. CCMP2456]